MCFIQSDWLSTKQWICAHEFLYFYTILGRVDPMDIDQPVAQLHNIADRLETRREELIKKQETALSPVLEYRQVPKQDLRTSLDRNVLRLLGMSRGKED